MKDFDEITEDIIVALYDVKEIGKLDVTIGEDGRITISTSIIKDVNEEILDLSEAKDYLIKNGDLKESFYTMCAAEKNSKILKALNALLIIAKAWNIADGFDTDSSLKYTPDFVISNGGLILDKAISNSDYARRNKNLYFKTCERADQFGRQFISLWEEYLLG